MKKKILAITLVLLIGAMMAGGTIAYFTDEETARNVITTGAVDITVIEMQETEEGLVPYPGEMVEAMPGSVVSKIVTVKNNESDAYIRAQAKVTIKKGGEVMEHDAEALMGVIGIDYNTKNWTEKDGWYYYNASVTAGESTEALFTHITFSGENMGNEYMDTQITVEVLAQAVQTANNGNSALEAAGWK